MTHTRVAEMAAFYIGRIRSIQPHGPYYLGGLCAGGVIAFEMALQLQALSEEVGLLALLDAADTRAELKPYLGARQRLDRIAEELRGHETHLGFHRGARIAGRLAGKLWGFMTYHAGAAWRGMRDRARLHLLRLWLDRGHLPPRLLGRLPVFATYQLAAAEYEPLRQLEGELVLFRATRGTGVDAPFIDFFPDPAFGWGPRASRGVRVIDVPGGHNSMLQEPHVSVLATRFQEEVDARSASRRSPTAELAGV